LGRHGQEGHEIVQAIAALELDLDAAEIERLERDYVPHAVAGPL
jgi:hypothetical protein